MKTKKPKNKQQSIAGIVVSEACNTIISIHVSPSSGYAVNLMIQKLRLGLSYQKPYQKPKNI